MILVVGGTGFIGSAIVRELVARGLAVAVLSRDPFRAADRFPGGNVECRKGDVTDPATLGDAMSGVETVIACQQFPGFPIENPRKGYTFENVDAIGTENLVSAAKAAGVERLVYLSGAGAAPEGFHWFQAKWRAEQAVRESGITYTILRPSWVYGPEDKALNRFIDMSKHLPFVPQIGDIEKQRMQPVHVGDVARAAADCLEKPAAVNQVFEIGGPEVMSMKEVVRAALEVAGRRRILLAAPSWLMKVVAAVFQYLPGRPLTPAAIDFITMDALADSSRIQEALGLRLTPLREGLATYLGRR